MLTERAIAEERMDAEDLDEATYKAVVHDLAKVNTLTMARRPTLDFLERAVGDAAEFSVLDVGYGDGDMLRSISRWAARRGKRARLVGVDLNPRSRAAAIEATPPAMAIDWRVGDYADFAGQGWDVIVSSLVAHHMTHAQLVAFVRFMEAEATRGWFVNDLHRHGFAHLGFPLLATIMRWHPIVKHDGTLSIARSYRPGEWPAILAEADVRNAVVRRIFPFRLCVEHRR
ncbi:Methyltransferase type 11 [Sphingomonas antarctica]|uniref:methyltransferase domain-containing protein n=1 Tax=Sphingomonas antarctica TaxID=2040274 RepID=UPI0039E9849C